MWRTSEASSFPTGEFSHFLLNKQTLLNKLTSSLNFAMRQISCHTFLYTPHIYSTLSFKDQGRILLEKKKKETSQKVKIIILFKHEFWFLIWQSMLSSRDNRWDGWWEHTQFWGRCLLESFNELCLSFNTFIMLWCNWQTILNRKELWTSVRAEKNVSDRARGISREKMTAWVSI